MSFENDIFISYAHLDEQPLQSEDKKGWISSFHEALEAFVSQYLGEKPKIWRDGKLQGNDDFGNEIVDKLEKAAVLVPVLSPRYVRSEWCGKEIHKFYEFVKQNRNYPIANKSRVFKVLKLPVELEQQLPKDLQALLGYQFYKLDANERPIEIRPEFGPEAKAEYLLKVSDLAYDIKGMLETIKNDQSAPENAPLTYSEETVIEKTIYLAETTFDLIDERDKIRRELQGHGYTVLPEPPLPYTFDFTEVVQENLKRCALSIHLIGERYGSIPEWADKSIVELQNEIAAEYKQENPRFTRLIWIPYRLQVQQPRQEEFIKFLQDDKGVLQTNLDELIDIISQKLNSFQERREEPVIAAGSCRQVYLIHAQGDDDAESFGALYEHLNTQNSTVNLPFLEGNQTEVRQAHEENLRQCDAVIIYWGAAHELWLKKQLRELQKAPGYGRKKPMLAQAVYVGEPQTIQKQKIQVSQNTLVIENLVSDALKRFLTQINQG